MKLEKGAIDILADKKGVNIKVHDRKSGTVILEAKLTPEDFTKALGRLVYTPCDVEVYEYAFNKIGKKQKVDKLEFEVPEELQGKSKWSNDDYILKLRERAEELLKNSDWFSDGYFNSQDSFFSKDGKDWARVTIRRWVEE